MIRKELDVVQMKDGRTATILSVFNNGDAYWVEIVDENGKTVDMPIVKKSDIEKILWSS